jgi:hypothetical protein
MPRRHSSDALKRVMDASTHNLSTRSLSKKSQMFITTAMRLVKNHLTVLSKMPLGTTSLACATFNPHTERN